MSALYEKFRSYTMVSEETFDANIALAQTLQAPGCVVECGVWRGGMIAAIAETLGPNRHYYLFDSFQGLPPAQPIDGWNAQMYQHNDWAPDYYDNCRVDPSPAIRAMSLASGPLEFDIVAGWFEETVPQFDREIALLRLDGDWYASTMVCLRHLYDKVAPGGLIIVDDFFAWDGCRKATLEFFSSVRMPINFDSSRNMCWVKK